jgi:hypothetical protein
MCAMSAQADSVATATARLQNVLEKFEGSTELLNAKDRPAGQHDSAPHDVQPGNPQKTGLGKQVTVIIAGSMTLDVMACTHGDEDPQRGTTLPGKVLGALFCNHFTICW